MPVARLPLTFDIQSRKANTGKDSRVVNAYVEGEDLVKRPGLLDMGISGISAGDGQGLYYWDDQLIATVGGTVYSISGTTATTLGTPTGMSTKPLSYVETTADDYLVFHDGSNIYTLAKGAGSVINPLSGTAVIDVTVDNSGTNGRYGPTATVTITIPGGSGTNVVVTHAAHGYTAANNGMGVFFTTTGTFNTIVSGQTYQFEYVDADTYNLKTTGLTEALVTATAASTGTITATYSPVVTFSGGTPARGTAVLLNNRVNEIVINAAGTYTSPASITIGNALTSTQAVLTPVPSGVGNVASVTVDTAGAGYFSPSLSFGNYWYYGGAYTDHTLLDTCTFVIGPASQMQVVATHGVFNFNYLNLSTGTYGNIQFTTDGGLPLGINIGLTYYTDSSGYVYSDSARTIPVTISDTGNGTHTCGSPNQHSIIRPLPLYVMGSNGYAGVSTITSPNSGTASAIANIVAGAVSTVTITNAGDGSNFPFTCSIPAPTEETATATAIMNSTVYGPWSPGIVFLDDRVYVLKKDTGYIHNSAAGDPTTWGASDSIAASSIPDEPMGIARHLNYILAFNRTGIQFFYDAGNPTNSPLNVNQSAYLEIGCLNGYTIASAEQTTLWLGQSVTEGRSVYMLQGLTPMKVSNPYVEKYFNSWNEVDIADGNLYAYCFKVTGHSLYILTCKTQNLTFVYDIDQKKWYQWTSQSGDTTGYNGTETYFTPVSYTGGVEYNPAIYLQGETDGKIYKMSPDYLTDDGELIYFRAVSPVLDSGINKRKFYRRAEVIGDMSTATVAVRKTDNDYQSWSGYREVDMSTSRPVLYQLGNARRRAWEVFSSSDSTIRIRGLELDFDIGEQGQGQEG